MARFLLIIVSGNLNRYNLEVVIRNIKKCASIMHFLLYFFSDDKSALFPRTKPNAQKKIDFPAPVSLVIVENPSEKRIDIFQSTQSFRWIS
jgi:hypothetical protein